MMWWVGSLVVVSVAGIVWAMVRMRRERVNVTGIVTKEDEHEGI